jgi:hypothetical protein
LIGLADGGQQGPTQARSVSSTSFFKYADMKYELCILPSGDFYGTPEDGFDIGAVYLE